MKKLLTSDKRYAERRHAQSRALERYNLVFNKEVRRNMITAIQASRAHLIERQSLRLALYIVEWDSKEYPVMYDNIRKEIVTFIPKEDDRVRRRLRWSPSLAG